MGATAKMYAALEFPIETLCTCYIVTGIMKDQENSLEFKVTKNISRQMSKTPKKKCIYLKLYNM